MFLRVFNILYRFYQKRYLKEAKPKKITNLDSLKLDIPCRFIAVGKECRFKEQCVYSHDLSQMKTCQRYLFGRTCDDTCEKEHSSENAPICFHFMRGQCKKTNCRFRHDNIEEKNDHDCLVCLTNISYGKRFALLPCCDICVCTDCMMSNKRKCPICKKQHTYIIQSNVFLKGEDKKVYMENYHNNKKKIKCRFGDDCKYNDCIYGH